MKKTAIIGINAMVIVVVVTMMIYPLKPEIDLKERDIRLRWYGVYNSYTLYVDDNREFTSPIVVQTERRDYSIELEPGVYFWKIRAGGISSFVKKLEIDSAVSIKVRNDSLENDGNSSFFLWEQIVKFHFLFYEEFGFTSFSFKSIS